jgi:hypothetical protein
MGGIKRKRMSNSNNGPIGCPYMDSLKSKGINIEKIGKGVVLEHIKYFSEKSNEYDVYNITNDSMTKAHTKQNIVKNVGIKVTAILNLLRDYMFPPEADFLLKVSNPAATGLWDKDGNFNNERFEMLRKKRIIDNGKEIITKQMFQDLRWELHGEKDLGIATWVYWVLPVSWKAITDGSINELFEYYADHWYKNDKGKWEKALTVDQVFKFYTDPCAVMGRRVRGELPVPQPSD